MRPHLPLSARLLAIFALLAAAPAAAQQPDETTRVTSLAQQQCRVIADTSASVPSARQLAERRALQAALDSLAKANGIAAPTGVLYVDVDSTRQGKVFFLDGNLPQPVADRATAHVAEYLRGLPGGRGYQALVRIDGEYPAMLPGRRSCAPLLRNYDAVLSLTRHVAEKHPERGKHESEPVRKRATVMLVVNREGGVSYVDVVTPTGDPFIDALLPGLAGVLRFTPATLDDVPHDAKFRMTVPFSIR